MAPADVAPSVPGRECHPIRTHAVQVYTDAVKSMTAHGAAADAVDKQVLSTLAQGTTMCCPDVLLDGDVPVTHTLQRPGELVVVLPGAYHAAVAHGQSIGETSAVATRAGVEFLVEASIRAADLHVAPVRAPASSDTEGV